MNQMVSIHELILSIHESILSIHESNVSHRPRWIFDAWFPVVSWGPPAVSHGLLNGSGLSPTRGIWPSCFWLITATSGDFFTDKHKNLKKNIKKFGEMKKVRIFAARFRNGQKWFEVYFRRERRGRVSLPELPSGNKDKTNRSPMKSIGGKDRNDLKFIFAENEEDEWVFRSYLPVMRTRRTEVRWSQSAERNEKELFENIERLKYKQVPKQ